MPPLPPMPVPSADAADPVPRFHRVGLVLALLAIVGVILLVLQRNGEREVSDPSAQPRAVSPNTVMELAVRYAHGVRGLLTITKQWNAQMIGEIEKSLEPFSKLPVDRFRVEIARAWMHDRAPDEAVLQKLETEAPWLKRDREVLQKVRSQGKAVAQEDWAWFLARHGWMARLARAEALPEGDAERATLAGESLRTMVVLLVAVIGMVVALVTGLVLLVFVVKRFRQGKLAVVVPPPAPAWGGVHLEAFAIYLCGWTIVPLTLRHLIPGVPGWVAMLAAGLTVPVAVFWPRWRGLGRQAWKQSLGLHTGKGVWREMGAGVLGWICTCPFIALGLVAAQILSKLMDSEMGHPIVGPLTTPGMGQILAVLLAVVWAPVVEELTFRGLMLPGFAALLRWVAAAVVGAFIFAVIHPQGWAAVPAIMIIALGASALRLVRGSLIAPMTLHAVNNGGLVLLLIAATG